MQSYLLEDLASTFAKHEAEFEEKEKSMRIQYKKDAPCEELPDWLKEEQFNLPRALSVMCCEIEKLKKAQQNAALDELVKQAQELKMGY